jgi:hypothetical protein
MQSQWEWIMMCHAERMSNDHVVLCWTSGCESWCAMLSQWVWIMVSYADLVVVNHDELWVASAYESWCVMLSHWLCIMVSYAEPIGVNHVLCCANGYESCCAMLNQWMWIMVCYAEPVTVNHGVLCWASNRESCFASVSVIHLYNYISRFKDINICGILIQWQFYDIFIRIGHRESLKNRNCQMRYLSCISCLLLIFC